MLKSCTALFHFIASFFLWQGRRSNKSWKCQWILSPGWKRQFYNFIRRSELGAKKRSDGDSVTKYAGGFLFPLLSRWVSISRFSHRCILFIPGFHCWKILHSLIVQKYECVRQTAGFFVVELNLKYESFVFGWNSEVSPKTTEASGDQRATGINYALLWTKLTKYWWGLLRCEAVPSGFLSGH